MLAGNELAYVTDCSHIPEASYALLGMVTTFNIGTRLRHPRSLALFPSPRFP